MISVQIPFEDILIIQTVAIRCINNAIILSDLLLRLQVLLIIQIIKQSRISCINLLNNEGNQRINQRESH